MKLIGVLFKAKAGQAGRVIDLLTFNFKQAIGFL